MIILHACELPIQRPYMSICRPKAKCFDVDIFVYCSIINPMSTFKTALKGLDPERMLRVAGNYTPTIDSPEDDTHAKLAQYGGVSALVVELGDRVENSGRFTPSEAAQFMAGAIACLEVLADYAEIEQAEELAELGQ